MIVRVEPFGHFERRDAIAMGAPAAGGLAPALGAARHSEISIERDRAAAPAIDFRDGADHHAQVEDMIVKRKII